MAVKIRLMRVGKKKQPTYRVVVADARSPRDGRIIETIGQYAPRQDPSFVTIDEARALAWLRQGAQPSEQVQKLLTTTGVWATFASEKSSPPVTQLSRRAYVTGRGVPTTKQAPATEAEAKPEPETDTAPAVEAVEAPEAVEPEAATIDETSADDTPADETPAEASQADEAAATDPSDAESGE